MTHLAVLGAGQLGAYLCRAARDLGVRTTLLAQKPSDTAVPLADDVVYGNLEANASLQQVIDACDVVTFELEDIPVASLELLASCEAAGQIKVAPSVDVMLLIQNKAKQKRWLVDHGFATAPFIVPQPDQSVADIEQEVGTPFVLKTQRGGYDGLGVKVVRTAADAAPFDGIPTIAEKFVEPRREFAVLAVRDWQGQTVVYPCVEMFFNAKGNVLRHVVSPANVADKVARLAAKMAEDIVTALAGVGVFAVEFFLQSEQLLVNEISPRVHNTGHLTIEAQPTSQFEQHVRAVCGQPFGPINDNPGAMINLLCEPELESACRVGRGISTPTDQTFVHWYDKEVLRPMRKMGHITATGTSGADALATAERYLQRLMT